VRRGAVYSPAITDFVVMVKGTSYMFVTGPDVIKTVTHEEVSKEELGGASRTTRRAASPTSRPTTIAPAWRSCGISCRFCRRTTSTIRRASATSDSPDREDATLDTLVPAAPNQPYDMLDLIHTIADEGYFPRSAPALREDIIVGFARLDGKPVGIVACIRARLATAGRRSIIVSAPRATPDNSTRPTKRAPRATCAPTGVC